MVRQQISKPETAGRREVSSIPKSLSPGRVLVHSHLHPKLRIKPALWTQRLNSDLVVCQCKLAGADLHGVHYRTAFASPWDRDNEAAEPKHTYGKIRNIETGQVKTVRLLNRQRKSA